MPRKSGEGLPHRLDIALGARVRLRRKELGLSQTELATAVGITFQQIQKYEHGDNRISFSRLVEMAHALASTVAELIGNLDKVKSSGPLDGPISFLSEPGAGELLAAYVAISTPKGRHALVNFARQLASDDDDRSQRARGHVVRSDRQPKAPR